MPLPDLLPGAQLRPLEIITADAVQLLAWAEGPRPSVGQSGTSGARRQATGALALRAADADAGLQAWLDVRPGRDRGMARLELHLEWWRDALAAVALAVDLRVVATARGLLLPATHVGWEEGPAQDSEAYGIFPHLDPVRGFAVRADRLPQVALLAGDEKASWAVFTNGESPDPVTPELVYALSAKESEPGRLKVALRYPQVEHGHVPGAKELAYLAKATVGHGEDRRKRWLRGERATLRLAVWRLPDGELADHIGTVSRHLWRGRSVGWHGPLDAFAEADQRARWLDLHLWRERIGQYGSPEGADVAMAGFIEMSLTSACVVARQALLTTWSDGVLGSGLEAGRSAAVDRALTAVDSWLTKGRTADGMLMPIRDATGFHMGRRHYAASGEITHEPVVEAIRPTFEGRSILALLRQAGPSALGGTRARRWRDAVSDAAAWLLERRVEGVLPMVVGAAPADAAHDDLGSAYLVTLLADLALDEVDATAAARLLDAARELHERSVRPRIAHRRFGGVTLDAACPDREAVVAALDACLALYEAQGRAADLSDARVAADALLAYVFTYGIRTFGPGSDADERGISTLGASVVSPENQHLDPFPVGVSLLRYGLLAGDRATATAGLANITWCMDGRWALHTADGSKQSEQLGQTVWTYDAYFTRRGDFRRGMPVFGRADSEQGWAQALPLWAWLEVGHMQLDWPSGRVTALPGLRATCRAETGERRRELSIHRTDRVREGAPLLLRILRPPAGHDLRIACQGPAIVVRWPAALASIPLRAPGEPALLVLEDAGPTRAESRGSSSERPYIKEERPS